MSIREDLQAAVEQDLEPEGEVGYLLWRGVNIPCFPSSGLDDFGEPLGPLVDNSRQNFRIRRNAFTTKTADSAIGPTADSTDPANTADDNLIPIGPEHRILYRQKDWRIDQVKLDSFGAFWLAQCVSVDA